MSTKSLSLVGCLECPALVCLQIIEILISTILRFSYASLLHCRENLCVHCQAFWQIFSLENLETETSFSKRPNKKVNTESLYKFRRIDICRLYFIMHLRHACKIAFFGALHAAAALAALSLDYGFALLICSALLLYCAAAGN